ncbi:hypothetical protein B7R87_19595 [Streptomyces tsukubensis]|nr:hypothetical protein B7R87_19595 [Streptomyces tsukubensis]
MGPDTTAIRSGPARVTSAITSLISMSVPSSTPFIKETRTVSAASTGAQAVRLFRRCWAETARTAIPAPSAASAASVVALMLYGSSASGR